MKFQVLHTNDLHNHFPGQTIQRLIQKPFLLLDSGDALGGSNTVFRFKEPIIQAMRETGYHAMAMGNREFHYIRGILAGRMRKAGFPILAANVTDLRKKLPVQHSVILPINELKIGIFGLTVPQYPVGSAWEKITGWRFFDPVSSAKKEIQALRDAGSHFIFCLSHSGFRVDQKIAQAVQGIHVIFGGHSHTVLKEPVWVNGTAIVQGGCYGRFVGNWEVEAEFHKGSLSRWTFSGELAQNQDTSPYD